MIFEVFDRWLHTRDVRYLVQGLPALLLASSIAVSIFYQRNTEPSQNIVRYQQGVDQAIARADFPAARLGLRKLLELAPDRAETRYGLALVAEHEGDLPRALRLMGDLAPADAKNFGPAHFWFVKRLAAGSRPLSTEDAALLRHHLEATLADDPTHNAAAAMLGRMELAAGELDAALIHLEIAARQRPELGLLMTRICLEQGSLARARRHAKQVADHFRPRLEADRTDTAARLALSEALLLQDKFDEAEGVLDDGLGGGADATVRPALANLYVAQADRLDGVAERGGDELALLKKALDASPRHEPALLRLAVYVAREGDDANEARRRLKEFLAEGKAPAVVHMILGTGAAGDGNLDLAQLHLEQAYQLNQHTPAILNNLAWVLANSPEPKLERALELVDAALKLAPEQPQILESRGQILIRLKRWREALTDLERALAELPNRIRIHQSLASAYEQLGDDQLAAIHRQRASHLKSLGVDAPAEARNR